MPESVACNLCNSDAARLLFQAKDQRLRTDDHVWNVVRCCSCGLGYLNPRPTRDEAAKYYPSEYFERRGDMTRRYEREAVYVGNGDGSLLDIGTARGDFLEVMRKRGWEVEGIEPSEEAGNPHGLKIHRLRFPEDVPLADQSFDVITAWAVFEHLHDPAAAFAECARLLRPGGRLVIQVPNLRSIQSRVAHFEDVPRHLFFFSASTLRPYGERVGLNLARVVHTTDLFGGSGRGVLRLGLVRALGRSRDEFFEVYRTPRGERFRRWPILAVAWSAVAAAERVLISDRLVRAARISGQIVALFEKPRAA